MLCVSVPGLSGSSIQTAINGTIPTPPPVELADTATVLDAAVNFHQPGFFAGKLTQPVGTFVESFGDADKSTDSVYGNAVISIAVAGV